jgi:hypothetical protein
VDPAGALRVTPGGGRVPDRLTGFRVPPFMRGRVLGRDGASPDRGRRVPGYRCRCPDVTLPVSFVWVFPGASLRNVRRGGGMSAGEEVHVEGRGAKVDLVVVCPSQGLLTEGAHRSVEEGSDGEEVYAEGGVRSEVRKSTS